MPKTLPDAVAAFLEGRRLAVAGVSRSGGQPANAIMKRLAETGHEVFPVNPKADEVDGVRCYPDILSLPEDIHGVVIATHPDVSPQVVRECGERGIARVWFHRSFGDGSVSKEAVAEAERLGMDAIVGGCPMMFCGSVDFGHRCMRWWLQKKGRVPR